MTTPTRQEIQAAYKALDRLRDAASDGLPLNKFALESVMNDIHTVLPTIPRPTMADVEWDDELHYLAEAENEGWGKVLMLGMDHESRGVTILVKTGNVVYLPCAKPQSLTPTGKRYTLTEVQDD